MAKTLYDTLGVAKGASQDEIKKAYRKLARQYHPDKNPGDQEAEDRFKDVQGASDVLSAEGRREKDATPRTRAPATRKRRTASRTCRVRTTCSPTRRSASSTTVSARRTGVRGIVARMSTMTSAALPGAISAICSAESSAAVAAAALAHSASRCAATTSSRKCISR